MSTLFIVASLLSIINAQTYVDCGTESITVGASNTALSIQLENDEVNSMVRITLTGPPNAWFGFVIGSGSMNGYAITGQGSNYQLVERKVTRYNAGSSMTSSGTPTATLSGSSGTLTLERPYTFQSNSDYFDFTDLLTCNTQTISFAAVIGSSLNFNKHADELPSQTFTRTCSCITPQPTTSMPTSDPTTSNPTAIPSTQPTTNPIPPTTANPTEDPTADTDAPTSNPTTAMPTADTMAPTADTDSPSAEPTTAMPTSDPTVMGETREPTADTSAPTEQPTTAIPTTDPTPEPSAAPTMEYEICVAETEVIGGSGVSVTILRKMKDKSVKIMMNGVSNQYFAFGFGGSTMAGTYAIVVDGEDVTDVKERILVTGGPGDVLSGDERSFTEAESNTITGNVQTVVINRPYTEGSEAFDFGPLMRCEVDEIDAISAIGSSYTLEYHANRDAGVLSRICECVPTAAPTSEPTEFESTEPESSESSTTEPGVGAANRFVINIGVYLLLSMVVYLMN